MHSTLLMLSYLTYHSGNSPRLSVETWSLRDPVCMAAGKISLEPSGDTELAVSSSGHLIAAKGRLFRLIDGMVKPLDQSALTGINHTFYFRPDGKTLACIADEGASKVLSLYEFSLDTGKITRLASRSLTDHRDIGVLAVNLTFHPSHPVLAYSYSAFDNATFNMIGESYVAYLEGGRLDRQRLNCKY